MKISEDALLIPLFYSVGSQRLWVRVGGSLFLDRNCVHTICFAQHIQNRFVYYGSQYEEGIFSSGEPSQEESVYRKIHIQVTAREEMS